MPPRTIGPSRARLSARPDRANGDRVKVAALGKVVVGDPQVELHVAAFLCLQVHFLFEEPVNTAAILFRTV